MKREVSHWKKAESTRNQQLILTLLIKIGPMRFKELYAKINETSKISQPTLSSHLKQLEKEEGKIERYWNKKKGGNYYQIKLENREKVEAQIHKYEAIKFIEGIPNPVYYYHPGKASISAFTSVPQTMNRKEWEGNVKSTVKKMSKLFNFIPSLKTNQKMAIVIMVRGKGVES